MDLFILFKFLKRLWFFLINWIKTGDVKESWANSTNSKQNYNSPYCSVCDACGEEGCCSALACQQSKDGDYCESYLRDLKFHYALEKWASNEIIRKLPKDLQKKYNDKWDDLWEIYYKKNK